MATKKEATPETNPNLELWRRYAQPPAEALKPFNNGTFSGTDISPMWRIKCLTEEFGAVGFGWYPELVEHWTETVGDTVMTYVTIRLYVKRGDEWSKPISATGGNKALRKKGGVPSDEAYKMAFTDALGGACKLLGFGGAIYWERGYSKYESDYTGGAAQKPKPTPQAETYADHQYRAMAVEAYGSDNLDSACQKSFGRPFAETPVEQIKRVLPEEKIRAKLDEMIGGAWQ